jgi:hypothetical protein
MDEDDRAYMYVTVGYYGRPETKKKILRHLLKPGYINRTFNCDVELLKVPCVM